MDKIFTVAGIALILVGVVVPFPQSVFNTFSVPTPTVSCSSAYVCTASVTVINNNATEQAQMWFQVAKTGGSQTLVLSTAQLVTSTPGSPQTFTQSLGTLACGNYVLITKVLGMAGSPLSYTGDAYFSPCLTLAIDSTLNDGIGITISPSTLTLAGVNTGQGTLVYLVPSGTRVTITATQQSSQPIYSFACWEYMNGGSGCDAANPLTLTVNQNVEVAATVTTIPGLASITIIPVLPVGGTISPSSPQPVYQSSGGTCQSANYNCPASATFTAAASTGNTFNGWFAFQNNQEVKLGTSNPITFNYDQALAPSTGQQLALGANFTSLEQLNIIDNLSYPGRVQLSAHNSVPVAAPGTTFLPPGTKVTISASGLPTTCSGPSTNGCYYLDGWIVDGVVVDQGQTSVTVTMNGAHGVSPNVVHPATSITGCVSGSSTLSVCSTTVVCQTASSSGATTTYGATTIVYTTGSTTCNVISNGTGSGGGSSAGGGTTTTTTGFGPVSIVLVIAGTAIAAFGVSRKKR